MADSPSTTKQDGHGQATETTEAHPPAPVVEEDSDPDFDDLDDVLDQFSANAPSKSPTSHEQPAPVTSGPGRPTATTVTQEPEINVPEGQKPGESEEDFIARLSQEMSSMLSTMSMDPAASAESPEDIAKMGKELEEFTRQMEAQGIQPEDLLKAILGEQEGTKVANVANEERQRRESENPRAPASTSSSTTSKQPNNPSSFEDTIRRTMSRLNESDTQATSATQQSSTKSEEDMLAEMLKALDSNPDAALGGSSDDESGLSKMFLDMMQQLTHKSMLYEPMKELHTQYPKWLQENKPPKLPRSEWERYQRQSTIVKDIVTKFEEPGFRDDDPSCRDYIWEKMQAMQGEGAPPESLVKNPFPGTDFGGIPGLGGGGGGGGGAGDGEDAGMDEGCPTQ